MELARFNTIEDFWTVTNHISLPNQINHKTRPNIYMFKSGIVPTWEDPANSGGCQWTIMIPREKRREYLDRLWLEILVACIGNLFPQDISDNINGVALQRRQKEDRINLWTKDFTNKKVQLKIGKCLKQILGLDEKSNVITCTPFKTQLARNTSFQYRSSNLECYTI